LSARSAAQLSFWTVRLTIRRTKKIGNTSWMQMSMRHHSIEDLELRERFWDILGRKDFKISGGGGLGARGVGLGWNKLSECCNECCEGTLWDAMQ